MNLETITKAIGEARKYPYLNRVGLFGSYSRSENNLNSDVDILIDYDDSSDDFMDNIGRFMEDMEKHIPNKIDYLTLQGVNKSKDTNFRESVMRDTKWIYISSRATI